MVEPAPTVGCGHRRVTARREWECVNPLPHPADRGHVLRAVRVLQEGTR